MLMGIGGLPDLLVGLPERFEFTEPKQSDVSDQPAWILTGRWRADKHQDIVPGGAVSPNLEVRKLPKQIPTHIVIVLSRSQAWPLFPHLIEYRRAAEKLSDPADTAKPMVSMEFFNVVKGVRFNTPESKFTAGDEDEHDITSQFIERLASKQKGE